MISKNNFALIFLMLYSTVLFAQQIVKPVRPAQSAKVASTELSLSLTTSTLGSQGNMATATQNGEPDVLSWTVGELIIFTGGTPGATNIFTQGFQQPQLRNVPLPVTLIYFTARKTSGQPPFSMLNWQTATETDNDYFEIERSTDGFNFKPIGRVKGAVDSYKLTDYRFEDYAPVNGKTNYYRLRQVDINGAYTYSKICAVAFGSNQTISVFPNPVLNEVSVFGVAGNKVNEHMALFDVRGKKVFVHFISRPEKITIDMAGLPAGIYFLKITEDQENILSVQKIVKL